MENNLKKLRKAKHFSRRELAIGTGINQNSIRFYEIGSLDLSIAKFDTILKLTEVLGCKASDLFVRYDYVERIKKINRKAK